MGMYNQPMYNQPMGMGGKGGGQFSAAVPLNAPGYFGNPRQSPSFNPFGNTQSMNRGFGPFGGNMMGSRTPSWAQPQYNMQQQMFNPYNMQQQMFNPYNIARSNDLGRTQQQVLYAPGYGPQSQPSFANSGWSDAADYYRTMGERAERMKQLDQFDYARQRANISQLNPFGPAAQQAAEYYSGIQRSPRGNYARSGMTDAMDRLNQIGKLYEGEGTMPTGGSGMVFDEDSGTFVSQRLTDEQQRARQQRNIERSAALLASIPQLGSKPGLASAS